MSSVRTTISGTAIEQIERRIARQQRVLWLMTLALGAVVVAELGSRVAPLHASNATVADSVLRVRGLIVVDEHGTERVRIAAPLPDPPHFGRRISRGAGSYAGIILMDATGTERSGYATTDEGQVMITLDEVGRMVMNFMAQPSGGVRLNLTDEYGNAVTLGSSRAGPFLTMSQAGRAVLTLPDTAALRR